MLGDAILAEPGAVIGFAGPRVIKQTLGQDLPEGFQTVGIPARPRHGGHGRAPPGTQADRGPAAAPHEREAGGRGVGVDLTDSTATRSTILFARTTGGCKFGLERDARAARRARRSASRRAGAPRGRHQRQGERRAPRSTALLRASGLRVARYTSPHLVDFRERIPRRRRADRRASAIVEFVGRWTPARGAHRRDASSRRRRRWRSTSSRTTAVDVAVIETGLGGRLDATNVRRSARRPASTSIGIDHVEYLGDTREEIAVEKAGIFKPGRAGGDRRARSADPRAAGGACARAGWCVARAGGAPTHAHRRPCGWMRTAPSSRSRRWATGAGCARRSPGVHQASNLAFALAMARRGRTALCGVAGGRRSAPGRDRAFPDGSSAWAGTSSTWRTTRTARACWPRRCPGCVRPRRSWRWSACCATRTGVT